MARKNLIGFLIGFVLLSTGTTLVSGSEYEEDIKTEKERVVKWRTERDQFFKTHQRSPLIPEEKKKFKGLKYFPFDSKYYFVGVIERYILRINDQLQHFDQ
jgi:uncharacterized protein (DUF1684 family)